MHKLYRNKYDPSPKKVFNAIFLLLIFVVVGLVGWKLTGHSDLEIPPQQSPPPVFTTSSMQATPETITTEPRNDRLDRGSQTELTQSSSSIFTTSSPQTTAATSTAGLKIYRNDEFGFEFSYPEDWAIFAKYANGANYYSQFAIMLAPIDRQAMAYDPPFGINVVLPEFADNTFLSAHPRTSTVMVGNVPGLKYEYVYEGKYNVAIVVPSGQLKIIFGGREPYEDIVNKIDDSFRIIPTQSNTSTAT